MAKNQVTLTFAGNSKDLEKSFDKVGSAARDMGRDAEGGFDKIRDGADTADTRAMGFRDTITGFQDINKGLTGDFDSMGDQLFTLGMGFGDLASGVANFGIDFIKTVGKTVAGWALMGAQSLINAAKMALAWLISLGPIGLVIAAIGAVIAILLALGIGFDDIKKVAGKVWDWIKTKTGEVWDWIKDKATDTKDWIVDKFNAVKDFITGLPTKIKNAASGMWDGIKNAFKSMINSVIGIWNNFRFPSKTFDIPKISGPGFSIGGGSFTLGGWALPQIPYLHQGGVFRAPKGQREGLAMLLDGEKVSRPGASSGATYHITVHGSVLSERDLIDVIRDAQLRGAIA